MPKPEGAAVRARTGAGSRTVQAITLQEEKAPAIMGEAACHGVPLGTDMRRGDVEHALCS